MIKNYFMKLNKILPAFSAIFIFLQSCKKDSGDPGPVIPADTTAYLPASISWASPVYPDDNGTAVFVYSKSDYSIKVFADDPATTTPFDFLAIKYYYTSDGYFTKKEVYSETGGIAETLIVERNTSNILQRVLFERSSPDVKKDTFNFSFADSTNPLYKIMTVSNINRDLGVDITVTKKLTFLNTNVIKETGGTFSDGSGSSVSRAGYGYEYDTRGRMTAESSTSYYGISYRYEPSGTGLDSLFYALGGVDGHYLTNYSEWLFDSDIEFYFFPLYVILANNTAELGVQTHRFGPLKEVRSVPNGPSFPDIDVYTFQNTFDEKERLRESKVSNNGSLYGTWTINY
jgi:hypothetical protein